MNFESFDIKKYLQSKGIDYSEEGENVSEGWINIRCIFCFDPKNHLGINLTSKAFSCWMCGNHGSLLSFISRLDKISYKEAFKIIEKFSNRFYQKEKEELISSKEFKLPEEAEDNLFDLHRKYLISRNFDPDFIFKKYRLKCTGPIGNYPHRLIIPYIFKNRILSFSTRDVTNKAPTPYNHCPTRNSLLSIKEMLYNIDSVKDTIIIVEGPADVWKLGDGVVATSGIKYTSAQVLRCVELVKSKNLKRAFILFDTDKEDKRKQAQIQAKKLAENLSTFLNHVEMLTLEKGDPADLTLTEVKELRKSIFGKVFSVP